MRDIKCVETRKRLGGGPAEIGYVVMGEVEDGERRAVD